MPPALALIATLAFCSFMLWRDNHKQQGVSSAVWLPVVWIFVTGSKFPGQWLSLVGMPLPGGYYSPEEGSPIDALFFLALTGWGIAVLVRRDFSLSVFIRHNAWLSVFLIYCFLAITWSDYPFIASKRWIKILGHPVMVLIIMTEHSPIQALRSVLKRSAYLMVPLSILFIKYYPELGRGFEEFSGAAMNRGIANNKNELGYGCMVFGVFFIWNLVSSRRLAPVRARREELAISIVFVGMIVWLFRMADSATAMTCTLIGVTAMAVVRMRLVSRRFLGTYMVVALLIAALAERTFGVYEAVTQLLGRDETLTDRTLVWADLLAMDINPVFGAGFESFWLGERLDILWEKWRWRPNQAHNGYIETYLNLGWIGVFLLAGMLFATFRKCRLELLRNVEFGSLRLAFFFAIVVYNYTEAAFKGVHLVWTIFHLIAIDYARIAAVQSRQKTVAIGPDPEVLRRQATERTRRGFRTVHQQAERSGSRSHNAVVDRTKNSHKWR